MAIISLTTDFGNANGFVGTLKGVIWNIAPGVQIADITHDIPAQDVRQGAIALWRAAPFFPPGSVHIAVVDPGVGTDRRPIGARFGNQFFIAPDNGLLTPMLEDAEAAGDSIQMVCLDQPQYWLPKVSRTFHGRDIFAPCGAHLAAGVALSELGTPITEIVRKPLPKPEPTETGYRAHILLADVFGNLTTDLPASWVKNRDRVTFSVRGTTIEGLVLSYGHKQPGELVALEDSEGYIEIALVNGSARNALSAQIDDVVEVFLNA
jgi:hypothetical protein